MHRGEIVCVKPFLQIRKIREHLRECGYPNSFYPANAGTFSMGSNTIFFSDCRTKGF